jgi:hypothetical protein
VPDPTDDTSISDDAVLWRRVPVPLVDFDATPPRPKSQAFDNSSPRPDGSADGMSVFLADEAKDPSRLVVNHPGGGVIAITAGDIRSISGQALVREPSDPGDPDGHVVVYGSKNPKRRKKFRDKAVARGWVIEPTRQP